MKRAQPYAGGYALALDEQMVAYAHSDGSLSLEDGDGRALDLPAPAVAVLAELLKLSSALRGAARRRASRVQYAARFGDGTA